MVQIGIVHRYTVSAWSASVLLTNKGDNEYTLKADSFLMTRKERNVDPLPAYDYSCGAGDHIR